MSLGRYKCVETAIGAVINGLFSLLFVFLVFGGLDIIPMQGDSGLLLDSIPQGLAIGFMGTFFPSFLTRKRIRNGQLHVNVQAAHNTWLPVHPVIRALVFAIIGATLSLSFFAVLTFVLNIVTLAFVSTVVVKTLWGLCLGGLVTAITIRLALNDYAT